MEEDIKILEKFTRIVKGKDYNTKNGWHGYYDDELKVLGKAIENLIKGYRELEEENKGLELDRRNLLRGIEKIKQTTPLNMVTETNYSINIDNDSIPKSKIKEKIEELYEDKDSKYYDMFLEQRDIEKTISVLQELLGDE